MIACAKDGGRSQPSAAVSATRRPLPQIHQNHTGGSFGLHFLVAAASAESDIHYSKFWESENFSKKNFGIKVDVDDE